MNAPAAPPPEGPDLVSVELVRLRMPLRHAHRAAHGSEAVRDLVLVGTTFADGTVGWGECSALARPTYSSEHTAGAWLVLRDEVVPAVLAGRAPQVVGHPMASAAVLTSLTDAVLQRVDRPLATELAATLGANPLVAVPTCAVISRADAVDDVLARVAERVQQRVAMVKLKVTPDPLDLATVGAVREAWPDLALAVDFNGTADADSLRRLDGLHLEYVEQPAPAEELVRSAHLASLIGSPVALDESLSSVGALDAAVALGAGRIANVKPARCGGPHAAAALVGHARNAGFEVFVGGMMESGVGRAAALAVAALPACTLPTDLGPSLAYFDEDITAPLTTDDSGRMVVPAGGGIGVAPSAEHLERFTVDRLVLRR
ncbi:enolase C-terminal domain-like protein [Aquihabitans daechungensis]|uniref:enolase C-terminal domain-like protein n=1 Tax=Aquihabitans daechungensis TaxID=1052257 RepID=UPI003BA38349